jgi:succinyl-CoA synthetase beta subunit
LITKVPTERRENLASFINELFAFYRNYYFAFLEINPLVVKDGKVFPLVFF